MAMCRSQWQSTWKSDERTPAGKADGLFPKAAIQYRELTGSTTHSIPEFYTHTYPTCNHNNSTTLTKIFVAVLVQWVL